MNNPVYNDLRPNLKHITVIEEFSNLYSYKSLNTYITRIL
jgi:hypothetical protein